MYVRWNLSLALSTSKKVNKWTYLHTPTLKLRNIDFMLVWMENVYRKFANWCYSDALVKWAKVIYIKKRFEWKPSFNCDCAILRAVFCRARPLNLSVRLFHDQHCQNDFTVPKSSCNMKWDEIFVSSIHK